jgi:peroxiredoxin
LVLKYTPEPERGAPAPDFALPDTNGKICTRDQITGAKGLLVMFICNHCPYVQALRQKLVREAHAALDLGFGVVAISANDVASYPQDAPEHMHAQAQADGYRFPYLYDETQQVARAYGAVCTPDFFVYNSDLALQYRGRLDASGIDDGDSDLPRELHQALQQIAASGQGPEQQYPSMGCSIKWK